MRAKEFLKQYEYANQRAELLAMEYRAEQEKIDAVRSTADYDGQPHTTGVSKPVERLAERLADKSAQWKMAELEAVQARQRVFDLIWDIPKQEGRVLVHRYIELMTWEDIAEAMSYSLPGVYGVHQRALVIVQNRLDARENCDNDE